MKNIAVFASGNGSNFQAIANAAQKGRIKARLKLLVCDNPRAFALKRAERLKIETFLIERRNYVSKKEFEGVILKKLKKEHIELIVLAGYMRIIGASLLNKFKNRIINIHPSLLPAFKGSQAIRDAFDYAVKQTGVTVHFVDQDMDHGPIILQEPLEIAEKETRESLEKRIHRLEHKMYPRAISLLARNRLRMEGRKVNIT